MKKALGSVFTLFGMLLALLIGGASAAQATVPPSNCVNGQHGLVNAVICEIDIDDNSILNGNDIKIVILNEVLSGNELNILTHALDNLTINIEDIDVDLIDLTIKDILGHPVVIIVLPCGCSH